MADWTCTGECLKCNLQQQTYCSAQRSYAILRNQEAIVERLDRVLARLEGHVEDIAQKSPGAENRGPDNKNSEP